MDQAAKQTTMISIVFTSMWFQINACWYGSSKHQKVISVQTTLDILEGSGNKSSFIERTGSRALARVVVQNDWALRANRRTGGCTAFQG
jgi:hypothetical protein